jgi:hypothetical protein
MQPSCASGVAEDIARTRRQAREFLQEERNGTGTTGMHTRRDCAEAAQEDSGRDQASVK